MNLAEANRILRLSDSQLAIVRRAAVAKPDIDLRLAPARRYRDLVAQIAIEGICRCGELRVRNANSCSERPIAPSDEAG